MVLDCFYHLGEEKRFMRRENVKQKRSPKLGATHYLHIGLFAAFALGVVGLLRVYTADTGNTVNGNGDLVVTYSQWLPFEPVSGTYFTVLAIVSGVVICGLSMYFFARSLDSDSILPCVISLLAFMFGMFASLMTMLSPVFDDSPDIEKLSDARFENVEKSEIYSYSSGSLDDEERNRFKDFLTDFQKEEDDESPYSVKSDDDADNVPKYYQVVEVDGKAHLFTLKSDPSNVSDFEDYGPINVDQVKKMVNLLNP